MTDRLPKPLRGIIPPMATPLAGPDQLDVPGLERLIDRLITGGIHGIFILGTTGEAPSLSHQLRHELVERTCNLVADRVPILVGITDTSFTESVNMARRAADCGAHALVMAPPYYFPAGPPELLEYLQHLTRQVTLPLFLYNMPYAPPAFSVETVRQASDIPGVVGIKDSSGGIEYFRQLVQVMADRPDFSLLMGPEELLVESLQSGGHGGVCGSANLVPRLYVDLYNAVLAGDTETANTLFARAMDINTQLFSIGRFSSSFIKGLKCALSCLGVCNDFMAEPFHRFRTPEREAIVRALRDLDIAS